MQVRSADNLKKLITFLVIILTVVSLCPQIARAVAPSNIITYQGRLLDSNGVPVSSATANISFTFYTAITGGSCLWSNSSATCATATARSVTLTDGLFTENLGDTTAGVPYAAINDSVFADNAGVYLEVVVGGETLTPRKQITAAPYAINSHKLDGLDSSDFLRDNGDTGTGAFDFTSATFSGTSPFVFEGSSDDAFETSFTITNPTTDNIVTFQNASGTVAYTTDIPVGYNLWEVGTNGTYEDDAATIVGSDAAFTHFTGAAGDLRVADDFEVIGNSYFDDDVDMAFTGTENLYITNTTGNAAVGLLRLVLTNTDTGAAEQNGLAIINASDATVSTTESLIYLDNADGDVLPTGLQINSSGVITNAIDVSAPNIVNALSIGANNIVGGIGSIDFTNFDVDATGNIMVATSKGLDTNAAGVLNLGATNATSVSIGTGSDADLTFADTTPTIIIGNTGTLSLTDSTQSLLTIADGGTNVTLAPTEAGTGFLGTSSAEWDGIYLGDDGIGVTFGAGQNAKITWNNSTLALELDGGLAVIGTDPTGTLATGDGDLLVQDAFEVDGDARFDGNTTFVQKTVGASPLTITGLDSSTSAIIDLNTIADGGSMIDIDWTAATQTAAISGLDVDMTNLTTDGTNTLYGIHVNDQAGNTASTEYGVYVQGVNWDYGLYVEDASFFGSDATFDFDGAENLEITVNPTNSDSVTGIQLNLTGLDSGSTLDQYGLVIDNKASSEAFDILTYLSNSDTDDGVGYGMFLSGGAGGIGTGIYMAEANNGISINNTNNTTAFTGKQIELNFDQNYTTGEDSIVDTSVGLAIDRNTTMNNSGKTLTLSGDMMTLTNNAYQTSGTLVDSANLLVVLQNDSLATGDMVDLNNNGTGRGVYIAQRGGASALGINSTGSSASAVIDVAHKTNYGEIIEVDFAEAQSLIGDLVGLSMDLNTSNTVTANDNFDVTGFYTKLPALTSDSGGESAQFNGVSVAGGNLTTSAADTLSWNGLYSVNPNITQTLGTLVASGAYLQTGTITTGGTQNGLYVSTTGITAGGTQNGINVNAMGVGAGNLNGITISGVATGLGTEIGFSIGNGWDDAININNGAFIVETTGAVDLETSLTIDSPAYVSGAGYTDRLCASIVGGDGAALDNAIIVDCLNAGQADYAEMYPIASGVTYGDIVVPGLVNITTETGKTIVQMVKSTTAYQNLFGGIVVDNYEDGTSAGYNIADVDNPMPVSLVGRVPVHVTNEGGTVSIGDPITTSSTAGYGMKATEPGMIIGYALNNFSETSGEVMVFVHSGWYAGNTIGTDGSATVVSDTLVLNSLDNASSGTPAVASQVFALRGSAWNGSSAQALDMKIQTSVTDTDNYRLSIKNTSDTEVAYITNEGTMSLTGDLIVTGRIYPSDRGATQTSKYIYYDGSAGPGGDMMRTNASGWSTGSYDFAEMFPSDEKLEAGDVVVFTGSNEKIGRSSSTYNQQIAGIISTRPGFLAGENDPNHFPVALAGRVPTKVNLEGGPIAVGDALTTSSTAGYAMKAAEAGMVVGYALEPYTGSGNNKITVFVSINYFDGGETSTVPGISNTASLLSSNLSSLNLEGGLYMGGNDILNIRRLAGMSNRWTIEEDGTIKTEATLKTIITSYQNEKIETTAVTSSGGTFITLVGSAELQNGEATISFETVDPNFNDITSTTEPIRVIITPNGPVSLYVSEKNNNGFIVKQIDGNNSNISFDFMVTATRKGFESMVGTTEIIPLNPAQDPGEATIEPDDITEENAIPIPPEDDVSDELTQETTQEIPEEEPVETESSFSDTESPVPGLEAISPDPGVIDESAPSESPTQTSDPVVAGEGGLNTEPPSTDSASSDSSTQTGI